MASDNGPNKPLIRGNTGVQDALLHNPAQSPFAYQAPMTCSNFINEEIIVRSQNFSGYTNTPYVFQVTKQCDLIGPMTLVVNYKPLTQPISPPTGNVNAIRYIQNLGIGQLDFVRIRYGSQVISNCLPEKMFIRYRKFLNEESHRAWRVLSKMHQTLAERNAYALTGGEVYTSLCIPWGDDTSQYFSMCGMADALYIDIGIKDIRHLLNYDLTSNANASQQLIAPDTTQIIADIYLHYQGIHLTGTERDQVVANIKSPNGQAKIVDDCQAHIRTLIPVQGSAFTYKLRLNNITGPVTSLYWYLEDPQDTSGSQINTRNGGDWPLNPDPYLGIQWDWYALVSGGNNVIPKTPSLRARYMHTNRWFSGAFPGEYIMPYSFSVSPEVPNASYGTLNFGTIDTPELQINFPAGLSNANAAFDISQGAYLNVLADIKNFYHEQGGDFTKTFY